MQYVNHASPPNHHGRLVRNRRMLAYVLKDRGPPQCVALGSSREIEKAVDAWREAVDAFQRSETTDIDLQTRELARLVWAPLQAHLQDVDTLSIAPDGPLCFVSFAALPGRHPGTYALEDFAISYVNSGRWLYGQSQATQGQHGTGLLLCGDIDYQRTKNSRNGSESTKKHREPLLRDISEWSNLAATGLEIEQVAALYQKSHPESARTKAITRGDATANAMEAAMPQDWQTIHFAGHGFFVDPEKAQALAGHFAGSLGQSSYFVQKNQLLLSGLGFAPTDDAPSAPSILTAKDVGSLNLRGTDLVVLSACETGLGCTAGSDGILGLTRAFLTAGSRSVISSLWKVEDSATSLLMEEFYRNLWERGQSKRDALRNAQITVLRTPSKISERSQELALRGIGTGRPKAFIRGVATPGRSHPALWAAFVLNGHGK
jgi:CHAT domain-containing protein